MNDLGFVSKRQHLALCGPVCLLHLGAPAFSWGLSLVPEGGTDGPAGALVHRGWSQKRTDGRWPRAGAVSRRNWD